MNFAVGLCAGAGLLLFVSGMPFGRMDRLKRRVDPYLSSLHHKPSALLISQAQSGSSWSLRAASRLPIRSDRELEKRLFAAGYKGTATSFRAEQLTWAMVAGVAITAVAGALMAAGIRLNPQSLPVLVVTTFALGFLGRDWHLQRQAEVLRSAIQEELPVALDLMTLSVMSGESVPAALDRVALLLQGGVGDAFSRTVADVRAGTPVIAALQDLRLRVPISGVARFVDAVCTSIERGAPLVETLRAQAEDLREERRRMLLEAGGRREILMLVPVVFLIMPVVITFALFPGLVSLDLLVP